MKYTRMYTGPDGLTHFEDVEVPLIKAAGNQQRSELVKTTGIIFRETGADFEMTWHNAPRRQFVVRLEGGEEIVASDGTTRRFGPGSVLLRRRPNR